MLIVDSQIHLWQNGKMSAHHRQIPTYSVDDALAEMAGAGVDAAVLHPPSTLGEATERARGRRRHAATRPSSASSATSISQSPDREEIVARWRERPGMLGFRFTFNQPQPAGVVDRRLARLVLGGLREGESCRSACSRGGNMAALGDDRRAPSAGSSCTSTTIGRGGGGPGGSRRRGVRRPAGDAGAREVARTSRSSCRARRAIRASPTRTATSTSTSSRSSTRSARTAASGAPTSRACRAPSGSA